MPTHHFATLQHEAVSLEPLDVCESQRTDRGSTRALLTRRTHRAVLSSQQTFRRATEERGARSSSSSSSSFARTILASSICAAVIGCGSGAPSTDARSFGLGDDPQNQATFRVVTANLTSGNHQSWDPDHGGRILRALKPDIVLMQELRVGNNSDGALRKFVDDHFGTEFSYTRESSALPNGIISRWPLLDAGVWSDPEVRDRDFVWAHIDLPGPTDLWAVSVHLLTSSSSSRRREAEVLASHIQAQIPADDLIIIGGDFNTRSTSERALDLLSAIVQTTRRPRDQRGNSNTNSSRRERYDWLLPSPSLEALAVPVSFGTWTFPEGFVFDTRLFSSVADEILPAYPADSDASGMQHMAVIEDFALPTSTTTDQNHNLPL